jgi:hypothetical protein
MSIAQYIYVEVSEGWTSALHWTVLLLHNYDYHIAARQHCTCTYSGSYRLPFHRSLMKYVLIVGTPSKRHHWPGEHFGTEWQYRMFTSCL